MPGDVVRISKDGVERAAVAYDGVPSVDGAPACIAPGATSVSGTFKHGVPASHPFLPPVGPFGGVVVDPYTVLSVWRSGFRGQLTAESITTEGDHWTATFPQPLAPGDGIGLYHAYTISTSVGVATVWSWRDIRHCSPTVPTLPMPQPPPPPPPVVPACTADALAADTAFETRLTRAVERLRLRPLRKGAARLTGLPACAGGTFAVEVKARGAVVARSTASATGTTLTQALTRTRRAARLAGRRRARVKVTIRIADSAGGALTWSCRVTVR
jgi:hypothetical protein